MRRPCPRNICLTVCVVFTADINECALPTTCPQGTCTNTDGSFTCIVCQPGFRVSEDGQQCDGEDWLCRNVMCLFSTGVSSFLFCSNMPNCALKEYLTHKIMIFFFINYSYRDTLNILIFCCCFSYILTLQKSNWWINLNVVLALNCMCCVSWKKDVVMLLLLLLNSNLTTIHRHSFCYSPWQHARKTNFYFDLGE